MQKLNATDNTIFSEDKSQKQLSRQYACSKENVHIILEVEVIESLYAAMSTNNKNSINQSGPIIRPGTAAPFIHFQKNPATLGTIKVDTMKNSRLQYRAKPYRRATTNGIDLCHLDTQQNRRLFANNATEGPAKNLNDVVGDLSSKVTLKPQTSVSANQKSVKLPHDDHCDSVPVELLKSYLTFDNSESKIGDTLPSVNPLVYQVHIEAGVAHKNYPLVELSAVQRILEAYEQDESPRLNDKHQIIEAMRKKLTEWGSDEKRITDILCNDTFLLMKCEHCGVISCKKAQILVPTITDKFSDKVDSPQQLHSGVSRKCLTNGNIASDFCDVSSANAYDQIPRNQSNKNTRQSKSSMSSTENKSKKDWLKVEKPRIKQSPHKSSEAQHYSPHLEPDTKLSLRRLENTKGIDAVSAVDKVTVRHERASTSENIIKTIDGNQKKELKSMLPSAERNNWVKKNESSNDTRLKNTCSTRYSSRPTITKAVTKPGWNTCRDNRNRNNFETSKNRTKSQTKNSTPLVKDWKKTKVPIRKKDETDDKITYDTPRVTGTNVTAKCKPYQDSLPKNKLIKSLVPPFNISTKLEKTSSIKKLSSKIVANYLVKEKPSTDRRERRPLQVNGERFVRWEAKQSLMQCKNNDNISPSKTDLWLWNTEKLLRKGIQEGLRDQPTNLKKLAENILRQCSTTYLHDRFSTDQESVDNDHASNSDNNQGSFHSAKNHKFLQIIPDYKHSAPLISLEKNTVWNKEHHFTINSLTTQYTGESETTAFSSSSSEDVTRETANSFTQVAKIGCEPLGVNRDDLSSSVAIRSIRMQIDKAIKKHSNYNPIASNKKVISHEILAKPDSSSQLDRNKIFPNVDYIARKYGQFSTNEVIPLIHAVPPVLLRLKSDRRIHETKDSDCIDSSSNSDIKEGDFETTVDPKKLFLIDNTTKMTAGLMKRTFNVSEEDRELKVVLHECQDRRNHDVHMVEKNENQNSQNSGTPVRDVTEKMLGGQLAITNSQETFNSSRKISFGKQKCMAIRSTAGSEVFVKSFKKPPRVAYKNPASVISSSDFSNKYHLQEVGVQQRSLCSKESINVLQINESETFERQISYDQIFSKDISGYTRSRMNLGGKALPVYRRILESKNEMDWETFQQLVGTLHPSQRELWSDICQAVSNEAKRVAGETGATTEVCIEINPIPTSLAFPYENKCSGFKTSGNETSFEMDMVLTDSETYFVQNLHGIQETLSEFKK